MKGVDRNRYYDFQTKNFDIEEEEIAFLYKNRCGREILFKKIKQNFRLHSIQVNQILIEVDYESERIIGLQ